MKRKTVKYTTPTVNPQVRAAYVAPVVAAKPTAAQLSARAKKAWATRRKAAVVVNNTKFETLPVAQQRVAIAKDVIAALKAQKLWAVTGTWAAIDGSSPVALEDLPVGTELQTVFTRPDVSCNVCALGACFVSAVRLGNNCKLTEDTLANGQFNYWAPARDGDDSEGDNTGMHATLSRYFDKPQLALIECAFELGAGGCGKPYRFYDEETVEAAVQFGLDFDSERERMEAIMNNIIKNDGEFKP